MGILSVEYPRVCMLCILLRALWVRSQSMYTRREKNCCNMTEWATYLL